MQDAVDEVADQLRLHRQVHDDLGGRYLVQFDAQRLVEGDAFEHLAYRLGLLGEQGVVVVHGRRSCG
jgi:hypothetical protein